jgi:hypothetical protein
MSTEIIEVEATEITTQDYFIKPVVGVTQIVEQYKMMGSIVKEIMVEGKDFGKIPKTPKNTLYKPGAEKLAIAFGLQSIMTVVDQVEDWDGSDHDGEAFFYYRYKCELYRGDLLVGTSEGSANSWEKKHRFRNKWENGNKTSVKNPDPYDLVNTILKMADKRAFVGSVLKAVGASEYFTQDIEDLPEFQQSENKATTTKTAPSKPVVVQADAIKHVKQAIDMTPGEYFASFPNVAKHLAGWMGAEKMTPVYEEAKKLNFPTLPDLKQHIATTKK